MNDPHVETMTYDVKTDKNVITFENPPPLTGEVDAFRYRLESGVLTVEMKEHHATVESARPVVEDFLKAWAMDAALGLDRMPMEFVFKGAHRIDRDPPPRKPGEVTGEGYATIGPLTGCGTGHVTPPARKEYPQPPAKFKATADVQKMWARYLQHIDGKEPLASMGYFCLSLLQWSTGSKKATTAASKMYNIDKDVLDKLGKLTSQRGTPMEARKLDSDATLIPLSGVEQLWVRAAVKALIRRKGEYDYEPATAVSLNQITMADLPIL